jgi:cytoskeletal protein CcmA (bactofilin family)
MFTSKTRNSFDENSISANTIIGSGTSITGDIASNGDIRVDGILKGNLTAKGKVLIGPDGVIEGIVEGQHADILG